MDNPTGDNNQGFQSTLSMRRATNLLRLIQQTANISIHALHEESDLDTGKCTVLTNISIHALHEESDSLESFRTK